MHDPALPATPTRLRRSDSRHYGRRARQARTDGTRQRHGLGSDSGWDPTVRHRSVRASRPSSRSGRQASRLLDYVRCSRWQRRNTSRQIPVGNPRVPCCRTNPCLSGDIGDRDCLTLLIAGYVNRGSIHRTRHRTWLDPRISLGRSLHEEIARLSLVC
jgi:hypothetical protein